MAISRTFVALASWIGAAAIAAAEPPGSPLKLEHAEPLFVDLIRDLGARKGEREWNIAFGLTDQTRYDRYDALVEYEWAPRDRLGLEVEVPFTLYPSLAGAETPSSRVEGLKTAVQWTFLVSERHQTSMALGYLNELQISDQMLVGIVTGVPIARESQRLSMFLRLIYEPRRR